MSGLLVGAGNQTQVGPLEEQQVLSAGEPSALSVYWSCIFFQIFGMGMLLSGIVVVSHVPGFQVQLLALQKSYN